MKIRSIFFVLTGLFLSACSFSLAEDITPPPGYQAPVVQVQPTESGPFYPLLPPDPSTGAPIYAEKCAPCHGVAGLGNGERAADLSAPVTALGDPQVARRAAPSDWFKMVTQGNLERFMPPFTSLSERQRWDVVAYAFTLSESPQTFALGEEVFQANCANCHGSAGAGDGPEAANLSGPASDLTKLEKMISQSGMTLYEITSNGLAASQPGSSMPGFADQLSEEERWAVVAYMRQLSFASAKQAAAAADQAAATPTPQAASAASPTAASQVSGSVSVQVVHGGGGELPAGLTATLYAFEEMQLIYSTTLSTAVDGVFTFENVEMIAGRAFLASVEQEGVLYGSDVEVVEDPSAPLTLNIPIYNSTSDPSGLVVDRLHIFFDFVQPDLVTVVELYIITNPTNLTVAADEPGGPVVPFSLPEGATNVEFQDGLLGERYLATPNGFADTQAVRPGVTDYQIIFAFDLPYERSRATLSQALNLKVLNAIVLMPDGIKTKSDQFISTGSRDFEGTAYEMLSAANLLAGSQLKIEISGKPKSAGGSSFSISDNRASLLIGLGALGVTLILVGVWITRRNHAEDEAEDEEDSAATEEDGLEDSESLMDAILALDDLYKEGQLPEEAYQQRRAELKARLATFYDESQ